MKTFILILFMALLGTACSKNIDVGSSSNYSYDFTENGCKTQSHSFGSLDSMCRCLQDDAYNNGCAEDLRAQYFQSEGCSGTFSSVSCQ